MHHFGFFGAFDGVLSIFLWVLLIIVIVRLIRGRRGHWGRWMHEKSALDILKDRYAKGEINKEEYEEKKKDLM